MNRIRKAYEARFRALLQQIRARRLDQGLQWCLARAEHLRQQEDISQTQALDRIFRQLRQRVTPGAQKGHSPGYPEFHSNHHAAPSTPALAKSGDLTAVPPPVFLCDAGLGGLARWLRGSGYQAVWTPRITDEELLREARRIRATILTTDSLLMERRVLRDGLIPALWLPPTLTVSEQLVMVFQEYGLAPGNPRCMPCGGELHRVAKETMRDRIPPKTWRWLDEYYVCARCGQLFWQGTHWLKISQQLRRLSAGDSSLA
jgi:uncharacterized protein with PIN domain